VDPPGNRENPPNHSALSMPRSGGSPQSCAKCGKISLIWPHELVSKLVFVSGLDVERYWSVQGTMRGIQVSEYVKVGIKSFKYSILWTLYLTFSAVRGRPAGY
jgi:hypothetical protein